MINQPIIKSVDGDSACTFSYIPAIDSSLTFAKHTVPSLETCQDEGGLALYYCQPFTGLLDICRAGLACPGDGMCGVEWRFNLCLTVGKLGCHKGNLAHTDKRQKSSSRGYPTNTKFIKKLTVQCGLILTTSN